MKITTNLSEFPEFKVDESLLKNAIIRRFSAKIKKPLYIHIDKNLVASHGHHRRDWITDLKRYPSSWSPQFISEIKKNGDLYHRICLSYEFLHNAFHNRSESNLDTVTWHLREYFDFDTRDYPYIYLFFLLSHELQHAQQCDSLRMKYFKNEMCYIQYKKNNWKEYKEVENNGVALEFDAEIASINKTLKLYESYF